VIGTIGLRDLRINCIVGIYDHERAGDQELILDVEVDRDFAAAAASDHVSDTLDYDDIARALTDLARERQYQLIETFAEEAAALLLDTYPSVSRVMIEIRKPAAVKAAACSLVRVERHR
jgi:dihydroneopterin aldolase